MEYEEIIEMLTSELVEKSLQDFRISDSEFSAKIKQLANLSKELEECTKPLNAESKEIVDNYTCLSNIIAGFEHHYLYVQGAKDCVRFLKELNVL